MVEREVEAIALEMDAGGVGGEFVTPHERRNSNSSALSVVHGQNGVDIQPC